MKPHFCLFLLLALGSAAHAAEAVSEAVTALGMLPNQRGGLRINADERNPFAVKPKDIAKMAVAEDTETQESKIRSVFRQIRVTGIRRDRNGRYLALAGDLILRQGEEIQPVLEEQTEVLIVSKIEPRQIELTFVEDKDSTQPRIIILPVKNEVQVSQKLFGQPKGKAGFFVARGHSIPEIEEAAAAIAAAPPTAPARAHPVATATGTPPAPAAPRDAAREAAALAGLSEPATPAPATPAPPDAAFAALIEGGSSGGSSAPSPAVPPAPAGVPDQSPTPASNIPPASPVPEASAAPAVQSAPPPTYNVRRTSPPPREEQPPPPPGTTLVE